MDYKLAIEKVKREELFFLSFEDWRDDKESGEGEVVWFYATTGFCGCDMEKPVIFDKKSVFLTNGEIDEKYLDSLCDDLAYENGESFYRGNEYDDGELSEEEQEEMYYAECLGHWSLEPDGCL